MSEIYNLTLIIARRDSADDAPRYQTYEIQAGPIMRFVDLLRTINDEQDPTLTWNSSCEHGQCGTCSMKINGRPMLACELLVENAIAMFGTSTFALEPLEIAPVVRDLVIDSDAAYERVNSVKPYIIEPLPPGSEAEEHQINPDQLEYYVDATRCINCFCCSSACISSHRTFLGPNAMLATIVRVLDPREQEKEERYRKIYSDQGVYRCHTSKACSHVCPKEIDVARFIALAKKGFLPE
ncbi:MAG: succinate dehydrogenase/fumarate reductase iron-sulfur subunit [Desulfofustis sp.]|nr:succinate dehydrogenase/fumarate reductase iron-sulfur subunit [Desulfofustis sp.]